MQELIEFRIPEMHASRWLHPNEGVTIGDSVRKYELDAVDPRMMVIRQAHQELTRQGRAFFTAWKTSRRYTAQEIDTASLFRLKISSVFEPAGEECGTKYDESSACALCGSGARQVSDLFLDTKRIPGKKDISKTIAGEIVVSDRVVRLLRSENISGGEFKLVQQEHRKSNDGNQWFQLIIEKQDVEILPPTKIGIDPFDEDVNGLFRCPAGDLLGPNLLSEVTVRKSSLVGHDISCSRQFVGSRRGLLRPEPVIFISPRLFHVLNGDKLRGIAFELAYPKTQERE